MFYEEFLRKIPVDCPKKNILYLLIYNAKNI